MKNKKVLIIGGITAILIAVGGFIFWQRKKAAEENALDELASRYDSETGGAESSLDTKKSQLGDIGEGTKMTQVVPTTTTAKILRVNPDNTKNKAMIRVKPKNLFKVGDSVKVNGSVYNGTFKVWHVYSAHQTEDAVYLDTPYISDDTGTATLA